MSRYDEIAKKAADWSGRFAQNRADCEAFARWFRQSFIAYLGAPEGMVEFVTVDSELRATGDREGKTSPEMLVGSDGLQYFGLSVHLEVAGKRHFMIEQYAIGLRQDTDKWTAYWDEQPFEIPKSDLSKADVLFDAICNYSVEAYDDPVTSSPRRIGFVLAGE